MFIESRSRCIIKFFASERSGFPSGRVWVAELWLSAHQSTGVVEEGIDIEEKKNTDRWETLI